MHSKQDNDTQALTVVGNLALASVDAATKDSAEDLALNPEFDQSEIRLPQLKVCQSMTPQRKRTDPNFIDGLQEGDLFNDASGRIYGAGPLKFLMLKYWVNYINFRKLDEGGGIICRADASGGCELNHGGPCPNGVFKGKDKPTCTKFMNYLFYLPDTQEIVWFSAKSTFLKTMRQFHSSLRAVTGIADYRKAFTLASTPTKNAVGQEFYVPVIPKRPIGIVPAEAPLCAELRQCAHDLATKTVDTSAAEVVDDTETIGDDAVPF